MARTREFDRDEALDGAMAVFWRQGYGHTNIADLVEATGVARYGWYTVFGHKEDIFVATLEHYRESLNRKHLDRLRSPDADLATIEAYFRLNLGMARRGPVKGCFACASALERGPHDERVARAVATIFDDVRSAFRNAIENAILKGEMRDLPVDTLVEFSLGAQRHLSILVRSGAKPEEVEAFIDSTLALLAP